MNKQELMKALQSWRSLNKVINKMTEDEVLFALEEENEREDGPRSTVVRRLTQRYNGIKFQELKKELPK